MTPLWPLYIEPFVRTLSPERILDMNPGRGEIAPALLAYCRETGCRMDIVDPSKNPELRASIEGFSKEHAFHSVPANKAIRFAEHPDLVLLGGEPNWSGVNGALALLRRLSVERGQPFPCVLARHTGWPYGRRDMYAEPQWVEEKHPFAYQGVAPGRSELVELGLNAHLAHAVHEGGPRNGVLTGIEDFIATAPFELHFHQSPACGGLGVLVPAVRMTPELRALLDSFFSPAGLMTACQALEAERIRVEVELALATARLERRTHALGRARELLARQQAEAAALPAPPKAAKTKADAAPADPAKPAVPGAPEEELQALRAAVRASPDRPKLWRNLAASLLKAGDYEGAGAAWADCLAGVADLERIAERLFPFLVELIQAATAVDPDVLAGRWALVRRIYAEPRFGELAARLPDRFESFVRLAGEDLKFKAAHKHGADFTPLVLEAMELTAPPASRQALSRACRAEVSGPHGGLDEIAAKTRRLMDDATFNAPVVICGFHHSGTRLLARLLAETGVIQRINTYQYEWSYANQLNTIIEPACMDPARVGSIRPEPGLVSAERLAFRMAMAGLEPGVPWGFKDPRNGLTAQAWLQAFPKARILHIIRDPVAALGTLPPTYDRYIRLDEQRPTAVRFWSELWEQYVQGARTAATSAAASSEIRFEDLCLDPLGVMGRLAGELGLGLEVSPAKLEQVPIESGKTSVRDGLRAEGRLAAPDLAALEALGERYGY